MYKAKLTQKVPSCLKGSQPQHHGHRLLLCATLLATVLAVLVTLQNFSLSWDTQSKTKPVVLSPEDEKLFPPQCSKDQLQTVLYQLPAFECEWANFLRAILKWNCSFSYASMCPNSVWYEEAYSKHAAWLEEARRSPTAIYVGCNKAMDAVHSLRMISNDDQFDIEQWKSAFGPFHGVCKQESKKQFPVSSEQKRYLNATVHCIEAMPATANQLKRATESLGWQNQLMVHEAALASSDGTVRFPNVNNVGVENLRIDNCQHIRYRHLCKEIPLYRLDTFANRFLPHDNSIIDFLSIDVEGYDYDVLLGGQETLQRTRYLEFEYHRVGKWAKEHKLSDAINTMKRAGFVCYWAGNTNRIWRITDCWLPHFESKAWSNVACANVHLGKSIADRMEELFLETLAKGETIQYKRKFFSY